MLRPLLLSLALAACACTASDAERTHDPRIEAADYFTERYEHSRFAKWNFHATAAGHDCGVLIVETSQTMDDSLVEAVHYGAGAFAIVDGGVENFLHKRGFRGVIYRDITQRHWTFGVVPEADAKEIEPCR